MNENLNLMDILKDCPKGYKLYSTIHGEVKFEQIITGEKYPIAFSYCDIACEYHIGRVTKDGKNMYSCCGECTLFPEKHQRDWSKFKVEPEMIDGEFYYCNYKGRKYIFIYKKKDDLYKTNNYAIIKINESPYVLKQNAPIYCGYLAYFDELRNATEEEKQQLLNVIKKDGYKWDEEKKELVKIEPEMVDGEIYYAKTDLVEWIYIYKKTDTFKTSHYVAVLNNCLMEFDNVCTTQTDDIKVLRKATEEEKRLFFELIEKNGRKWDADKKELVKAEPKFDKIKDLHLESLDKAYNTGYNDAMQNALEWLEMCLHYHDCGDYDTVALSDDTIEDAIERFKEDNSLKKTNL